ncbi:MAG: hypothetical protein IPH64_21490 [Comamonadaceae bacterium]|nr:hypothetical protein [Comamonadaceae bacterium]
MGSGTIEVKPNIAALTTLDARTDAAIIVDQLTAAYKTYTASSGNVPERVRIARPPHDTAAPPRILQQISHWKGVLASEKRAESASPPASVAATKS